MSNRFGKTACSFLCHVTAALAAERRAAIDRYLVLAEPTAANLQQRSGTDGRTDRRTPYRCVDPAPPCMPVMPMNKHVKAHQS